MGFWRFLRNLIVLDWLFGGGRRHDDMCCGNHSSGNDGWRLDEGPDDCADGSSDDFITPRMPGDDCRLGLFDDDDDGDDAQGGGYLGWDDDF